MFLLQLLVACSEYDINGLDSGPEIELIDQGPVVQDAVACVYTDHSDFIPGEADVEPEILADAAAELAALQQDQQAAVSSVMARTAFDATALASGQVPAHLVVDASQAESFNEDGTYGGLLVIGATDADVAAIEDYDGASLIGMATDLSLSGFYAQADVSFGSIQSMSFTCDVYNAGSSQGEIDMKYTTDTTGSGTIRTTSGDELPIADSDNETVQSAIYAADEQIATTTTSAVGVTLDTENVSIDFTVVPLNQYLLE